MKSALLHFPYGEVFNSMEKVCRRNGFRVMDTNEKKGEINAEKGNRLFGNKILLHLKIQKQNTVKVNIEIVASGWLKRFFNATEMEEKIVDSIYRHF
jgi:hypothetical protein